MASISKPLLVTAFLSLSFSSSPILAALSTTPDQNLWITDDNVHAIIRSGNDIYIGGAFNFVGPNTGKAVPLNTATGAAFSSFDKVNGIVRTSVSDGSGGWFIGGDFSKVGSYDRMNLAHIQSNGSVDPNWNPNVDSTVFTLIKLGDTLFVGGFFTTAGGLARRNIAAVDVNTGVVSTTWDPGAQGGAVRAFAIIGTTLYVGGDFSTLGGAARQRLGAIDNTGAVTSWNPGASNEVYALAPVGVSTIVVGGLFTTVGGAARNGIGSLSVSTNTANSWNPNAAVGSVVYALIPTASSVYVGGDFTTIGGQTRRDLAEISLTTGLATAWDADSNGSGAVYTMTTDGTLLYVGGTISSYNSGATIRYYSAAINLTSGAVTSWYPLPSGVVYTLGLSGSSNENIMIGGDFVSVGASLRHGLARLNATTGQVTTWDPNPNSTVRAMAMNGTTLYVGGLFTTFGATSRSGLASFDTTTGNLTSWDPDANNSYVYALLINGNTIYVGGNFSMFGATTRNLVASFDLTTGALNSWDPNGSGGFGDVYTLAALNNTIYVGGDFTTIGGQSRTNLAAIDANGLATVAFNPSPDNDVRALLISGSNLYVGGDFGNIAGSARTKLAVVDATNGSLGSWNPLLDAGVLALTAYNGTILAGGSFSALNSQSIGPVFQFDNTNTVTSWAPNVALPRVNAIFASADSILIGGEFNTVNSLPRANLALFSETTSSTPTATLSNVKAYPMPFRPAQGHTQITFTNLTADAEIKIYTYLGELVKELRSNGSGTVLWNVKNDSGQPVASGVYVVFVKGAGGDKKFKIAVQR